jgi:selenocysteine-specific elongation factor
MVQQPRFAKEMLSLFAKLKWITMENEKIRLNSFESFDQANFLSDVSKVKEKILNAQYEMLTIGDLIDLLSMGAKEISRIISYLKEQKELVIIGQEFLLPKEIFLDFKTRIQAIDGDLTLGKARDLTNSSRKYMLPLLEYFDSIGITRRVGDKRIILKRK